jgi:hypothetical protein
MKHFKRLALDVLWKGIVQEKKERVRLECPPATSHASKGAEMMPRVGK